MKLTTGQSKKNDTSTVNLNSDLFMERLLRSQGTIVSLIKNGEEELWPIFDRFEQELKNLEKRKNRLSRYIEA